ncbi:GntR family transcriptional regulator [Burkholderia sp. WSM2232]|uniref:GntR family transcriptional regulator n=1 Tax=Burkholderia sp. WSM2232 TaxID=944436 RepID=UPI0003FBBB2B|nr:GntR family transcriptional regulator [Burkholderia sp. WSM2232]
MNDHLQPIERANMSARVYSEVREALIAGSFMPNERIRIHELAERFGTSATPVREALMRLVSERALDMQAAKMISVPPLDTARYVELRTIRLSLEPLATELATPRLSKRDLAELNSINKRYIQAGLKHDPVERMRHNREFHFGIYSRCGLPTLLAIIETLWASTGPILRAYYNDAYSGSKNDPDSHREILDALGKADAQAAGEAIRTDLLGAGSTISAFLDRVTGN